MQRIADYTFIRSLGEGNYGEFYLATPPPRLQVNAEHVAVKVVTGNTSENSFRRATKELRAFASVRSPHLVKLYDAGQEGGTFYYAMEYLPLGSLASPAKPLDKSAILRAVADAAKAAHSLHEAGVAHRDIKPANVMLSEGGGKLSDLGLAQFLNPGQSVTGMGSIGSIEFMDPAMLRGERGSRATDIWSLGATLHRALTGAGLYGELPDTDPLLAMRRVLTAPPAMADSLTPAERELLGSCLSADPADRPSTALILAERIEALAEARV